jgi:hypothetical protein
MLHRLLLSGLIAIGVAAAAMPSARAQRFTEAVAAGAIGDANALSGRIRAYHRGPGSWTGLTPVPGSYCPTMRAGEAVVPGLALRLQRAGDALSDELDEEEEINQQAGIPYTVYPCPVPAAPYPARAIALRLVEQRVPACRRQADALRVSFEARRRLMQQCLRRPGL